jgi:ABC-type lipoprotein release transport system permease subunit
MIQNILKKYLLKFFIIFHNHQHIKNIKKLKNIYLIFFKVNTLSKQIQSSKCPTWEELKLEFYEVFLLKKNCFKLIFYYYFIILMFKINIKNILF